MAMDITHILQRFLFQWKEIINKEIHNMVGGDKLYNKK